MKKKNNVHLSENNQIEIYNAYKKFKDQDGFSIVKTEEEILNNKGSLKITDYLKRSVNVADALSFPEAYEQWEESSLNLTKSFNQLFETV